MTGFFSFIFPKVLLLKLCRENKFPSFCQCRNHSRFGSTYICNISNALRPIRRRPFRHFPYWLVRFNGTFINSGKGFVLPSSPFCPACIVVRFQNGCPNEMFLLLRPWLTGNRELTVRAITAHPTSKSGKVNSKSDPRHQISYEVKKNPL